MNIELKQQAFLAHNLLESLERAILWINNNKVNLLICEFIVKQDNVNKGWVVNIYYKILDDFSNLTFENMK